MANYLATDTDLTAVADAIRQKGGTSAALAFPAGFVSAIGDIPTGGGGWTMEDVVVSKDFADFWGGSYSDLAVVNPYITSLTSYFFAGWKVKSVNLPNLKSLGYNNYIANSSALQIIVLSRLTAGIPSSGFRGSSSTLKTFDMGPSATGLGGYAFRDSTGLTTLILRNPSSVVTLNGTNVFDNTPFASGKAGGTLYVPSSLISSYQSATNWSTILGYSTNSILPIEGSIYETQYADGTPIT